MLGTKKRTLLIILTIMLFSVSYLFSEVTAQYHIIETYDFQIPGKTRERIVRREIIPVDEVESFISFEELEDSLIRKRQHLFNTRLFNQVSYTYKILSQEENKTYYKITFFIDDSFTFLPIPYAKYDSNDGFRVGVKVYERNLLGTFTDLSYVGHATQVENSFDTISYFSELRVNRIPIGESSLNLFGMFEFIHEDRKHIEDGKFDIRVRVSDLNIFNNTLSLQTQFVMKQDASSAWGNGALNLSADIGRIQLFNQPFRPHYSITLLQTENTWKYPDFESLLKLTWLDLSFLEHPYSAVFASELSFSTEGRETLLNRIRAGLQSSFSLPLHIHHQAYIGFSFEMEDYLFFVPSNYMLDTMHTFTKGSINWNNNFREGNRGLLRIEGDYSFGRDFPELRDRFTYTLRGELTSFTILWDRLNISTRTMGFFAHRPQARLDQLDPIEDASLFPTFLPGRNMNSFDQLRGILRVKRKGDGVAERKLGLTFNLNMSFLALKLDDFAEGFLTPFFDFGVFHNEPFSNSISFDQLDFFSTAGLEAHVIFDRFRSYPFRGSIGFNLEEVNEFIRGDRKFRDIENEIVITMELHF